jgi:hypothetical protein
MPLTSALWTLGAAAAVLSACGGGETPDTREPVTALARLGRTSETYCGGEGNIRDLARIVQAESLARDDVARAYAQSLAANLNIRGVSARQAEAAIFTACLDGLQTKHPAGGGP